MMDPAIYDKAMGFLLKTNIIINRWASREDDLRRIRMSCEPSMQNESCMQGGKKKTDQPEHVTEKVIKKLVQIEEGLDMLYLDSLVLMSSMYAAGRSRSSRFGEYFSLWVSLVSLLPVLAPAFPCPPVESNESSLTV